MLSMLFSLLAFPVYALVPEVGQQVIYTQRLVTDGESSQAVSQVTLQQIVPEQNSALIQWVTTYKEGTTKNQQWMKIRELKYIEDTRSYCAGLPDSISHNLEVVVVRAGQFLTCRYSRDLNANSHYTAWVSDQVPFGIVKDTDQFSDGDSSSRELSELPKP